MLEIFAELNYSPLNYSYKTELLYIVKILLAVLLLQVII